MYPETDEFTIYPFGRDLNRASLAYDFDVGGSDPSNNDLCSADEWIPYLENIEITLSPYKWGEDGNVRIDNDIQLDVGIFCSNACAVSLGDLLERTFNLYDDEPENEMEALIKLRGVIDRLISTRKFRAAVAKQRSKPALTQSPSS